MNSMSIKKHKIDKKFIKKILLIAIPIVLEQLLASSFGVVDTIMVKFIDRGISGVGLASQIANVVSTVMFACATGVGMYIAQYYGDRDENNIKNAFSLLLFLGFLIRSRSAFNLIGSKELLEVTYFSTIVSLVLFITVIKVSISLI